MLSTLTQAQRDWLAAHPEYELIGRPRVGTAFKEFGTLFANGTYEKCEPSPGVIRMGNNSRGVGIRYPDEASDPS